jgi:hypothetical protein
VISTIVTETKQYAAKFIKACKDEPETQFCVLNWKDVDSDELNVFCYHMLMGTTMTNSCLVKIFFLVQVTIFTFMNDEIETF